MEALNILVTGGAGFIGSHLVDALVAAGHRVRVLDKLVPQVHGEAGPQYVNEAAEFIHGDVADRATVERSLEAIDVVYHQAAEVGVGQSMYEIVRYAEANMLGTAVLLQGLVERRGRIRKLVVASSMSIYGEGRYQCEHCGEVHPGIRSLVQLQDRRWELECPRCASALTPLPTHESKPLSPTSVYAITKQNQEQMCLVVGKAHEIPTVALRYFNAYGPRQALSNPYTGVCAIFSSRLRNGQPPVIFEDGQQTRDFVHVRDLVQANLLALATDQADYRAVNVGTGSATPIREVARSLAEGLECPDEVEIVGRFREGDIRHCFADISRARSWLGYEPRVPLSEGMKELLAWVREQEAADLVAKATAELEKRRLLR
jgi:dTDP-L-rhamnose 4-epimerase